MTFKLTRYGVYLGWRKQPEVRQHFHLTIPVENEQETVEKIRQQLIKMGRRNGGRGSFGGFA